MVTDCERQALQRHTAAIEQYEADVEAERERLRAPFAAELTEWWDNVHQSGLVMPAHGPAIAAHVVWRDDSRVLEIDGRIKAGLWDYAQLHPRPDIQPWDTPGKVIAWIDERAFSWSDEVTRLRKDVNLHDEGDRTQSLARPVYQQARQRVLAFADIAPSVRLALPEAFDPIIGLQDIRAWCEDARRIASNATAKADPIAAADGHFSPAKLDLQAMPKNPSAAAPPEGEWSMPKSLMDLANRLGNIGVKKAKTALTPYGLKPAGNRQLWTVRLDKMPANMRASLEKS